MDYEGSGCYICDEPFVEDNKTVLEHYPNYQFSEYKSGEPIYTTYKFCPNCGRKLKKRR